MRKLRVLFSVALLVIATPVLAGSGEKCTMDAQRCLNHWAGQKEMGWTGLELDKSQQGVVKVKAVTPDSPAAAAGFLAGDVLVALNGAKMADKEAMKKAKGDWKAGQAATYTVQREGAEKQIAVTLARMPEKAYAAMIGDHMLQNHVTAATAAAAETGAKPATKEEKK